MLWRGILPLGLVLKSLLHIKPWILIKKSVINNKAEKSVYGDYGVAVAQEFVELFVRVRPPIVTQRYFSAIFSYFVLCFWFDFGMILVMKKIIIAIVILLVISLGIYFLYFYDSNNYMDYNGSKFSFKYPDTLVIQEPIAGYPSAWVKDANLPYHIIMLSNHLTKNVPDFRFEMDYFETVLSERVEILLAEELNFSGYKAYYLIYKNPDSSNKQADIFI